MSFQERFGPFLFFLHLNKTLKHQNNGIGNLFFGLLYLAASKITPPALVRIF